MDRLLCKRDLPPLAGSFPARPQIRHIVGLIIVQFGAKQVFAAFTQKFANEMIVPDSGRLIGAIGVAVSKTHPEMTRIFLRPEP